ncbi:MAG: hypothetical protein IT430_03165 [Phycisphaerales bacterium]|nr:hypothetical protein [Phycisphaerales bacterium]
MIGNDRDRANVQPLLVQRIAQALAGCHALRAIQTYGVFVKRGLNSEVEGLMFVGRRRVAVVARGVDAMIVITKAARVPGSQVPKVLNST